LYSFGFSDVIVGFASQRVSQVSNFCAVYEKQRWENPITMHQARMPKNQKLPKPEPNQFMWVSHL